MKDVLDIPRTAMEVFEILPEGTACEVIDNTLYMSPSPTTDHQRLLFYLARKIQDFVERNNFGEVILSPCDVYLNDEQNVVQPDILFIKKGRESIIQQKGILGAPDLVIEILSSNKSYDQQVKKELYQDNHIPEYIIIDPGNKTVWQYVLEGNSYVEQNASPGKLNIRTICLNLAF